jgi:Tfp pilus assembly protein PilN
MATTLVPPSPSPAPSRPSAGEIRFVAVRASLMPDEVLSARQVLVVRKQVLLSLVAVLIALIAWFGLSWWQTQSANSNLDDLQRQGVALQSQQGQFTPLVQAQAQITNTRGQLEQLMVGDLSWKTMLTTLRDKAPAGVALQTISGDVTDSAAGTANATGVLNQTGSSSIGVLTVTGTAPDKRTVAAYADALSRVKGVAAPLISSVQSAARPVTFTITADITSDALGGRYATSDATGVAVGTGGN